MLLANFELRVVSEKDGQELTEERSAELTAEITAKVNAFVEQLNVSDSYHASLTEV